MKLPVDFDERDKSETRSCVVEQASEMGYWKRTFRLSSTISRTQYPSRTAPAPRDVDPGRSQVGNAGHRAKSGVGNATSEVSEGI